MELRLASLFFLFVISFLAATLLPFSSELGFLALLQGDLSPILILVAATLGNTLGAIANWLLGLLAAKKVPIAKISWFKFKVGEIDRAQKWFRRFGKWSLLISWFPLIGDALTFVAGSMRIPLLQFTILAGTGKASRYIFLLYVFN